MRQQYTDWTAQRCNKCRSISFFLSVCSHLFPVYVSLFLTPFFSSPFLFSPAMFPIFETKGKGTRQDFELGPLDHEWSSFTIELKGQCWSNESMVIRIKTFMPPTPQQMALPSIGTPTSSSKKKAWPGIFVDAGLWRRGVDSWIQVRAKSSVSWNLTLNQLGEYGGDQFQTS